MCRSCFLLTPAWILCRMLELKCTAATTAAFEEECAHSSVHRLLLAVAAYNLRLRGFTVDLEVRVAGLR